MITTEQMQRFQGAREAIFKEIDERLAEDGHCKSYEGRLSIVFPDRFSDEYEAPHIHLACYLLCSGREETFTGASFEEALQKLEAFAL